MSPAAPRTDHTHVLLLRGINVGRSNRVGKDTLIRWARAAGGEAVTTHLASGISVRVQSQRSQHANKRLALLLIGQRLAQQAEQVDSELRAERRLFHHRIERGNPRRVFRGERFEPADE